MIAKGDNVDITVDANPGVDANPSGKESENLCGAPSDDPYDDGSYL